MKTREDVMVAVEHFTKILLYIAGILLHLPNWNSTSYSKKELYGSSSNDLEPEIIKFCLTGCKNRLKKEIQNFKQRKFETPLMSQLTVTKSLWKLKKPLKQAQPSLLSQHF